MFARSGHAPSSTGRRPTSTENAHPLATHRTDCCSTRRAGRAKCGARRSSTAVTGDLDTVLARTVGETPHAPAAVRAYFEGSTATTTATALHLTDVTEYETPVTREQLSAVVEGFTSPQNFRYLSPAEYEQLRQSGR
ncbi:hypothetical protein [Salinigranum halophilum]|uniref:hypothetical protein n=1 Tax=Salinigranum halophilum TaxID=2565931 RepID=UPI00115E9E30|nr:hypothetical protein [Salinigranum halophilum]